MSGDAPRCEACDACLGRAHLLGFLAPYIERALASSRRLPELLALPDEQLVEAACGRRAAAGHTFRRGFGAGQARHELRAAGLGAVCRHSDGYPRALLEAGDPPAALFYRGEPARLQWLEQPAVALVGARRPSGYGERVAAGLARQLAGVGTPVVSGLALGIDSAAHGGALEAPGPTVAVLGGGADVPYPRTKVRLYERIAAQGLVLSELPPGLRPRRWCFPARNRVMAALARMTVVVEGRARSGSLITADFARQLGREVGAVPGQIDSELARVPNDLIYDGAVPVRGAGDVLDALYGAGGAERLRRPEPVAIEPRLAAVLREVDEGRDSVDALARDADHAAELLAAFGELELMGLLRRGPGGRYSRPAPA